MANSPLAWITTAAGKVAQLNEKQIITVNEQTALDLGVGKDGQVWIVTEEAFEPSAENPVGGNKLAYLDGESWTSLDFGASKVDASWQADEAVAVLSNGSVATVDKSGKSTVISDENFAMDVSAGPDGTIWVVSTEITDGGDNLIKYYNAEDKSWVALDVPGEGVSGRPDGSAIVVANGSAVNVNKEGQVLGGIPLAPGTIKQLSVAADGSAWVVTNEASDAGGNKVVYVTFTEEGHLKNIEFVPERQGVRRIDAFS